jgi:threonine synthase
MSRGTASPFGHFTPLIGGWVGFRVGLDAVEKRKSLTSAVTILDSRSSSIRVTLSPNYKRNRKIPKRQSITHILKQWHNPENGYKIF